MTLHLHWHLEDFDVALYQSARVFAVQSGAVTRVVRRGYDVLQESVAERPGDAAAAR